MHMTKQFVDDGAVEGGHEKTRINEAFVHRHSVIYCIYVSNNYDNNDCVSCFSAVVDVYRVENIYANILQMTARGFRIFSQFFQILSVDRLCARIK